VAVYATSFALQSNAGYTYKAVGPDLYRNPIPWHGFPRKHSVSNTDKCDSYSSEPHRSRECHAGGGRPVIPPLQVRSGRMIPAWVALERARARRLRVESYRAGDRDTHRCR
jgi:hypothetical protein